MESTADIESLKPAEVLSIVSQSAPPDSQRTLYETARVTVPMTVRARTPPYLMLAELESILSYKLAVGVNRPFLKAMLKKNTDAQVREVSERAVAVDKLEEGEWENVKNAMDILCELKGVGPALASLVLSLLYPTSIPFFSDETAVEVLHPEGGRKGLKYTLKEYKQIFDALTAMRDAINARNGDDVNVAAIGNGDVERAIWTTARERNPPPTETKKRKASAAEVGESEKAKPTKKTRTKRK